MVVAVALLLVPSGSGTLLVTLAVLVRVPVTVGMTVIWIKAEAPLLIVARSQMMVLVPVQVPWLTEK